MIDPAEDRHPGENHQKRSRGQKSPVQGEAVEEGLKVDPACLLALIPSTKPERAGSAL
jgi:hypothetical protein